MKRTHWTAMAIATVMIVMMGILAQPAAAGDTAGGKAVFDKHCAKCHGDDGAGKTTIGEKMGLKDLGAPDVQKASDADWAAVTADGKGKMPGYSKKLSKEEIQAVVQYMRTMKN